MNTNDESAHVNAEEPVGPRWVYGKVCADAYEDLLIATALGDSLGLPYENMGGKRVRRITKGRLRQRFLLGRFGVISDDIEHALITARALLDSVEDENEFELQLSKRLKRWLQAFPPGVGKATLMAIMCMWFKAPAKCGRPSAGNGPLMRAPVVGLFHADDQDARDRFVKVSTRMTHSDSRALFMASAIADIVAASNKKPQTWPDMSRTFRECAERHATEADTHHIKELMRLLEVLDDSHAKVASIFFAMANINCGNGIDGYVYRSALGAAYIASHTPSVHDAIHNAIQQGGDTDSTAAITAALSVSGGAPFMRGLIDHLRDWPVSKTYLEYHAKALGQRQRCEIPEPAYAPQLIRNLGVVLLDMGHIIRRFLPPYA